MLKLIHIEFLKLRRQKQLGFSLFGSILMPFLAILYFKYLGTTNVEPILFYKWALLGLTCWVILPFICGIFSVLLMYNEQHFHIKQQLWLASVSKLNYFLSKFFSLFIYSFIFILLSCIWTLLFASFSQNVTLTLPSILWLIKKWIEISILFPLAMLPILTAATFGNGYILPICLDLVYIFSGFIMASQTFCIHPLSSLFIILNRNGDIPGVSAPASATLFFAICCLLLWDFTSILIALFSLKKDSK